jgi:tetratricopeptide (TPR) repeat protein
MDVFGRDWIRACHRGSIGRPVRPGARQSLTAGHRVERPIQRLARRRVSRLQMALLTIVLFAGGGCAGSFDRWSDAWSGARHYAAGTAALEDGDTETAVAELNEAARRVPHSSEVRNHLGLALWEQGALEQARSAFESAIELDCDNEAARRNLALLDRFERQPAMEREGGGPDGE